MTKTKYSQNALDYVIYMMAGSYFKKAECSSKLYEKKLCISYRETKERLQFQMEDIVIDYVEKEILPQLPADISQQSAQVQLVHTPGALCTEIRLCFGDYILRIAAVYKGSKTKIQHQLWHKSC